MTTGWLLTASLVGGFAGIAVAPRHPRLWLAFNGAGAGTLLVAAFSALLRPGNWEWRSGFQVAGEPLHLRLDGVSGLFLVLVATIGLAGAMYAHGYWNDRERPESAGRGRVWWSALTLSMGLVLVCSNGLHFLMAWEAFALSAYFLLTLDRGRREVRSAGWLYLAASHAGTLALTAFFVLLAARTGGWDLNPARDRAELAPLFWVALFGFGVKAGMFPLHFWLPSAHASAPSHVSAIMSGVAIKMGLYGIVRFSGWLPLPPGAGWVVLLLGMFSAVLGAVLALAQTDLKRLLAYCSVENMGVILIGLGAAMLGALDPDAPWARLAVAGAFLHVWNHGLIKSLLFLGAGSVVHATGTREMSRMGGVWRAMPWTASLFAFGAAAISALPPFNGFVSEWLIYLGLFDSIAGHGHGPGSSGIATAPAAIALGLSGALALAAFVKASAVVFLGTPRTRASTQAHECDGWMRIPMIALAILCLVVALVPVAIRPCLRNALASWNPGWAGDPLPVDLPALGAWQLGIALAAVATSALLWVRAGRAGMRRRVTWDCGYAVPTARMQYTGGSFSGTVVDWVRWFVRPELRLKRPRGLLPHAAGRTERIPETVLERILAPAGTAVMGVSAWVRCRQQGRLPDYILYLVMGLAAVGLLVFVGSMR